MSFKIQYIPPSMENLTEQALSSLKETKDSLQQSIDKTRKNMSPLDQKITIIIEEITHATEAIEKFKSDKKLSYANELIGEISIISEQAKKILKNRQSPLGEAARTKVEKMRDSLKSYKRQLKQWESKEEVRSAGDQYDKAMGSQVGFIHNRIANLETSLHDPYEMLNCYGEPPFSWEERIQLGEQIMHMTSLSSVPTDLPPLDLIGRTPPKILLVRTKILCQAMENVLGWKYNRMQREPNQEKMAVFYKLLVSFEKYLKNDLATINKTYLSQAKDISDKLTQCFTHHFTLEEQMLTRDHFKAFTKECAQLHEALA